MANRKINELVSRTPSLTDLMLVGDPSSGYSYKCTVNDVALAVETGVAGNYVTLATTQTISGAKTFSNVLTLTSVANSPTDTDKFLVLNASNVVNYRTGAQMLSDIGAADDSLVVHKAGAETITGVKTFNAGLSLPNYQQINLSNSATIEGYDGKVLFRTIFGVAGYFQNNSLGLAQMDNETGTSGIGFLVKNFGGEGLVKYKTAAQALSMIGAQGALTLTTTGSSGAATLVGNTLNIPNYGDALSGYVPYTGATANLDLGTRSISTSQGTIVGNNSTSGGYLGFKQFSSASSGTTGLTSIFAIGTTTLGLSYSQGAGSVRTAYLSTQLISNNTAYYYDFPNKGGTFALLDDVTGAISGTTNYIPKFTSSSAIGNSNLYDQGTYIESLTNFVVSNASTYRGISITTATASARPTLSFVNTNYAQYGSFIQDINGEMAFGRMNYDFGGHSEQMRLTSTGLGIGTSSPTQKLYVADGVATAYAASSGSLIAPDGGANIQLQNTSSGGFTSVRFVLLNGSNAVGYLGFINTTGSVGGSFVFGQRTGGSSYAEQMRLDASGNLGLGVTPSAWGSGQKAIQFGSRGIISNNVAGTYSNFGNNAYFDGTNWIYLATGTAGVLQMEGNNFYWQQASSGTAGNAISFTQAMTLDASGRLGIGTTAPKTILDVYSDTDIWHTFIGGGTSKLLIAGQAGSGGVVLQAGAAATLNNQAVTTSYSMTLQRDGGNVGIGTSSPSAKLHISSGDLITEGVSGGGVFNNLYVVTTSADARNWAMGASVASFGDFAIRQSNAKDGNPVSSGTTRFYISNSGNVGIGTTSPDGTLVLSAGTAGTASTGGYIGLTTGTNSSKVRGAGIEAFTTDTGNDHGLRFYTNAAASSPSERMRITSGGNVGIGTTSPSEKLEVNGNIKTAAPTGGTAKPWKLGERVATGVTLDSGQYIRVEIDGVTYYLATVTIN